MANVIISDTPDANGQGSSAHSKRFEALLILLTSKLSSFKLYAICAGFYKSKLDYRQWLEYTGKTYRSLLNNPTLNEDKNVFVGLVEATLELANCYLACVNLKQEHRLGEDLVPVCPDGAYQARMAVKAVIGRSKLYNDTEEYEQLQEALQKLKS